ncbi:hypothetical protein ACO0SA_002091 [Hanseniaspora valbyensis]
MVTYASIVKGATKIKLAPPKEKYLTPILIGCSSSSSSKDAQDILFLLHKRLSDSAFTICYKSLIVLHYILNECNNSDNRKLLKYVYNEFLNGSSKKDYYCRASESDLMALKRYKEYLFARISISYKENNNKDLVNPAHLEVLKENNSNTNSKNKIQIEQIINTIKLEIECIGKLLKNKYSIHDLTNTNNLLLTCFKLLTNDLLVLYNILNEGIITILESFFELKLELQKETCELYDDFVMITEDVVKYLKIGKQCGLSIPVIKHITTKLGKSLREHLESTENVNNSNSNGKSSNGNGKAISAKEQLENVRKQRQLLESQLRMTSNDLSTPQKTQFTGFSPQQPQSQEQFTGFSPQQQMPSQTGTNPFLMNSSVDPQATNNVFLQQPQSQQIPQPQQFPQPQIQQQQIQPQIQQQQIQPQIQHQTGFQQPQQTNNVFLQQQQQPQVPQQTNNVFLQQQAQAQVQQQQQQQQQPQQQIPQQTNNAFLQQPQTFATNLVPQQTNNPFFTQQPTHSQTFPLQQQPTKSHNPFSMENVQKENLKRQETNPFSLSNQPEVENKLVNNNPFGLQNQQQVFTNVQPQQQQAQLQQLQQQQQQAQLQQQQQLQQLQQQQTQYTGFAQQQQQPQYTGFQQQPQQQQQQYGNPQPNQAFSLIDL